MHQNYRRVVTGHDKNGSAIIESDQIATQILERPNRPGVRLTNFWMTDQTPAEYVFCSKSCQRPLGKIPMSPRSANSSIPQFISFSPVEKYSQSSS